MTREIGEHDPVVLPIRHGLTAGEVAQHSALLADRVSLSTDSGLDVVCEALSHRLRRGRSDLRAVDPRNTFKSFTVGRVNQMAHAASIAVASIPATTYNPLYIYGPPGSGKTHLLHAIASHLRFHHIGLSVKYLTTEGFTHEFVNAVQKRDMRAFRSHLEETDVLLLDDVQYLAERPRTEEELFHRFNDAISRGAQLVITSDRPPFGLTGLAEQFQQRLAEGLVVDIGAPDLQLRLDFLRDRASAEDVPPMDAGALEAIADQVPSSIRALTGALMRVAAYHSLRGGEGAVTVESVTDSLKGLYPAEDADGRSGET